MANIGWPAALFAAADPIAALGDPRLAGELALGQLKAESAGRRVGLGQLQLEMLADAVGFAGLVADQRPSRLVIAEILVAEDRRRDQPVAAEILDRGEEA